MYYTYAYLREDGTPYYIGKGKGKRVKAEHRVSIPTEDRILYLKQNLTEEEAHKHEIYMISVLGRKDIGTGILRNLTDGGEGVSGRVMSEETRNKLKERAKGRKPPGMKGRKHSIETKQKIAQKQLGKKMSDESSRKKSEATKGKWNGGGRKGMPHTEETKRKMSISSQGKNSKSYKICYNDGRKEVITNLRKFGRDNDYSRNQLNNILSGKIEEYKGIVSVTAYVEDLSVPDHFFS